MITWCIDQCWSPLTCQLWTSGVHVTQRVHSQVERWERGHDRGVGHPEHEWMSQRGQRVWSPGARWSSASWIPEPVCHHRAVTSVSCLSVGHEGRIGMAAVTVKDGAQFDGGHMYEHVVSYLPSYARPRFIRIQVTHLDTHTSTHRGCVCMCVWWWTWVFSARPPCRTPWSWRRLLSRWRWSWWRKVSIQDGSRRLCSCWTSGRRATFLWALSSSAPSHQETSNCETLPSGTIVTSATSTASSETSAPSRRGCGWRRSFRGGLTGHNIKSVFTCIVRTVVH